MKFFNENLILYIERNDKYLEMAISRNIANQTSVMNVGVTQKRAKSRLCDFYCL